MNIETATPTEPEDLIAEPSVETSGLSTATSHEVPKSLGGQAKRGGFAVGSAQLIRVGVQMLSVVVLSRMLKPEDFGLVAAVTPVISFLTMFQDLGYGQAIVQRSEISEEQISSIFWTTALLGVLCMVVTMLCSPGVAWFFHEPRLVWVTVGVSVPILLGSLMSVPSGLLNRRLQFKALAISDVLSSVAGLAAALIAASLGARYWALVISSFVSAAVMLVGYWKSSRWVPSRPRAKMVDKEIGRFGANLTGFSFVNYFSRNLDNILIGRVAGSIALGYYDRAYKLLYFPIANINGPLSRVMTPMLSRVQHDKRRFREMYLRSAGQLTLLIVPGMAALAATSNDVVTLLFGARWQPVAPIFFYLGVCGLLQPLNNSTGWIFISQGRTDVMFKVGVFSSIITVAAFVVGLHYGGAVGLAAAYAFSEYVFKTPVIYAALHRIKPVSAIDLVLTQLPLIISGGITLLLVKRVFQTTLGMHGLILILTAVAISYLLALAITAIRPGGRAVLSESQQLINQLVRKVIPG